MDFTAIFVVALIFVGMPWVFLHYSAQIKKSRSISGDDEQLLDDLYHTAQRLDDRINTIERIMDVDNPDWRRLSAPTNQDTLDQKIEDRPQSIRRVS